MLAVRGGGRAQAVCRAVVESAAKGKESQRYRNFSTSTSAATKPTGSSNPSTSSSRHRTDIALIVTATLSLAGLGVYTLKDGNSSNSNDNVDSSSKGDTFSLPVATSSGTQFRTIAMYSQAKVAEVLTANEKSYSIARPGNPLYRYDTNTVASNQISEDTLNFTILEKDGKDWILCSVFDGHSGYHTSRLLADTLKNYIANELFGDGSSGMGDDNGSSSSQTSWWNWLWKSSSGSTSSNTSLVPLDGNGDAIASALRNAYRLADKNIVQSPVKYMQELAANNTTSSTITEAQRKQGIALMEPATAGACSLSALIDTKSNKAYLAVAGDSRAVMGTYDASRKKWIASQLTVDQTGKNVHEVERMRSLHPKSESDSVIIRGRVLGGLEPTRSLGDAKYKWPVGVQEKLVQLFKPSNVRMANPSLYKTPPYVTADPEVSIYDLTTSGANTDPTVNASTIIKASGESLVAPSNVESPRTRTPTSFIVMATDGLFDCLSSEEVVALVGGHLDGLQGPKSKKELLDIIVPSSSLNDPSSPHKPLMSSIKSSDDEKKYIFKDGNISTHLIRNALGGNLSKHLATLLSIPPPYSRRYRDDITISVMLFNKDDTSSGSGDGSGASGHHGLSSGRFEALQGVTRIYDPNTKARAKL